MARNVQRRIGLAFLEVWRRICQLHPHALWVKTVSLLQPLLGPDELSNDRLAEDPLLILRCSKQALQQPVVVELVLTMLRAYMDASANRVARACAKLQVAAEWPANLKSNLGIAAIAVQGNAAATQETVLLVQAAAIVQVLLDLCLDGGWVAAPPATALPAPQPSGAVSADDLRPGELTEIRIKICHFVHQLFIESPPLARIIHFQGYRPELLEMMALGVPSMHVCIGFLAELMVEPGFEHQIFSVQIAGALAVRYPVPQMLQVARLVVGKAQDVANADVETRHAFFMPALQPIASLCGAFPLLTEGVITLLLKLQSVHRSQRAVDGNFDPRASAFGVRLEAAIDTVAGSVFAENAL